MGLRIGASLAAAPLERLSLVIPSLESAGVDYLHFDVEDGLFVPVMSLGTKIIGALRPLSSLPFDVHLMMLDPEWLVADLIGMGVERISVHLEACRYPRRVLRQIVSLGAKAGLALNPATALPELQYLLPYLSFVVILTTEPEFPNSPFLSDVLQKVIRGCQTPGLEAVEWVVDGGVSVDNLTRIAQAGASSVVVGRGIFRGDDVVANVLALREAGRQAA